MRRYSSDDADDVLFPRKWKLSGRKKKDRSVRSLAGFEMLQGMQANLTDDLLL